jgi:hypothetical protein
MTIIIPHIDIEGGSYLNDNGVLITTGCLIGAPGTLFVQTPKRTFNTRGSLFIYNNIHRPHGVTEIERIPSNTGLVHASSFAIISGHNITLPQQRTCASEPSLDNTNGCTLVVYRDAAYICSHGKFSLNVNCSITADAIQFMNSTALLATEFDTTAFSSKYFYFSLNSSMTFANSVYIVATTSISLYGKVRQMYDDHISTLYMLTSNITMYHLVTDRLVVDADNINILSGGYISAFQSATNRTCASPVDPTVLKCDYRNATMYDRLVIMNSSNFTMSESSYMSASLVFICGTNINVNYNATITTDGSGCLANQGLGSGLMSSLAFGGGGGANGGNGGNGQGNATNGGKAYNSPAYGNNSFFYSGSGGGCNPLGQNCSSSSSGGGIISLRSSTLVNLYGNLTSRGMNGTNDAGGGAGGSIVVLTQQFKGSGYISAIGGAGGKGKTPGGGGGGGYIQLSSSGTNYDEFTFLGYVNYTGGQAGITATSDTLPYSNPLTWNGEFMTNNIQIESNEASAGSYGIISLPVCDPGTGNDPTTGDICYLCPVGTYSGMCSLEQSKPNSCIGSYPYSACSPCQNDISHAHFTESGVSTSNCPYECDEGYSTDKCYNQFQKFFYDTLGVGGVAGLLIGLFAFILIPLFAYRIKKYRDFEKEFNLMRGGTDFLKTTTITDVGIGFHEDSKMPGGGNKKNENFSENPMVVGQHKNGLLIYDDSKSFGIRKLQPKYGQELRREHRIVDQDLMYHAARVNFLGTNHPFISEGITSP